MRKRILISGLLLSISLTACTVSVPQQMKDNINKSNSENVVTTDVVTDNKEANADNKDEQEDPFAKEVSSDKNEAIYGAPTNLYLDGYHFVIPSDYYCMYDETIGPIVYMSNVFQMKFGVRETPYNDLLNDLASTTKTAKDAGAEITQDSKTMKINGVTYIYYGLNLDGDNLVVVLSDTPDHKGHLGGQFVIESKEVTNEDMVHVYASICETIEVTSEPNSTAEDIEKQQGKVMTGERKASSSVSINGKKIEFSVPDGFYSYGGSDAGDSEFFECATYDVTVEILEKDMGDAKQLADVYVDMNEDYNPKLEKKDVNGKTIYVITGNYTSDRDDIYNMVECFYDYNDECVLHVYASNRNDKMPNFEEFKGFFDLK